MKLKFNPSGLRSSKSLLLAASALLVGSSALNAATPLVNWGGDYVASGSEDFQGAITFQNGIDVDGDLSLDDARFGRAFSSTNPFSPANVPPGTYAGTNDTFYGGYVVNTINATLIAGDVTQPNNSGVHQNGSTDYWLHETQHSGGHDHTFAVLNYWDKANFLNGGPLDPITLAADSQISITTRQATTMSIDAHLHFVIRDGTDFYFSKAYWSDTVAAAATGWKGAFPDGATINFNPLLDAGGWYQYNPTGLDLKWTHDLPVVNPTFTNITGVGFYVDSLLFTSNNTGLQVSNFSFAAVPEPSRALLALSGLGMIMLRRRRARA